MAHSNGRFPSGQSVRACQGIRLVKPNFMKEGVKFCNQEDKHLCKNPFPRALKHPIPYLISENHTERSPVSMVK